MSGRWRYKVWLPWILLIICTWFLFTRVDIQPCQEDTVKSSQCTPQVVRVVSEVSVYSNQTPPSSAYMVNCTNIKRIAIGKRLGKGVSKETYAGVFEGRDVAVKMVTPAVDDIRACIHKLDGKKTAEIQEKNEHNKDCFIFPNMKLLKEILLITQLNHPGIIGLLGYCVRDESTTQGTNLDQHGIIAVYERASALTISYILKKMPLDIRLRTAHQLAEVLDYLAYSPLGSLAVKDLKEGNLMIAEDRVKISDLDDLEYTEAACKAASECVSAVQCLHGRCVGQNAALNMDRATKVFFSKLLKCGKCGRVYADMNALLSDMRQGVMTAAEVMQRLRTIQSKL